MENYNGGVVIIFCGRIKDLGFVYLLLLNILKKYKCIVIVNICIFILMIIL